MSVASLRATRENEIPRNIIKRSMIEKFGTFTSPKKGTTKILSHTLRTVLGDPFLLLDKTQKSESFVPSVLGESAVLEKGKQPMKQFETLNRLFKFSLSSH